LPRRRESARTALVSHPMMNQGGDAVSGSCPKAMWLAEHEPEVYRRATRICEAVDWINFQLTGRWVAPAQRQLQVELRHLAQRFPVELYAELGIPELAEKLPPQVIKVGGRIGPLTADAASHLGLSRDTLVAQGGIDAHMAMLSAGTTGAGELLFIGGTSVVQLMHTPKRIDVPGIWGPYPGALLDGQWLMEGGKCRPARSSTGWRKDVLARRCRPPTADSPGCRAATGSTGLLVLDYRMGNRTPYRSPDMRGAIMGLSLNHDRHDLYRASVEAIALARRISSTPGAPKASRSPAWSPPAVSRRTHGVAGHGRRHWRAV
jgi:ribulose kinase